MESMEHINFNPHSPCGERLKETLLAIPGLTISIHTPHAGSDGYRKPGGNITQISIHTPHAGSDIDKDCCATAKKNFNPHSPCGERRFKMQNNENKIIFQSTLPMRGATAKITYFQTNTDFYLCNNTKNSNYLNPFMAHAHHFLKFSWCEPSWNIMFT